MKKQASGLKMQMSKTRAPEGPGSFPEAKPEAFEIVQKLVVPEEPGSYPEELPEELKAAKTLTPT